MYTAYELEQIEKYILVPESLFDGDLATRKASSNKLQVAYFSRDLWTVREACGDPDGEHDDDA